MTLSALGTLTQEEPLEKRLTRQGDARIAETARNNLFNQTLNNLKFSRGYSEGSYKEVWNTEAGRMEKVWVPKYGGPSLDGRPALPGKPRETERRIPTDQLQFWVNPETLEAAAPGMTPNDANDKGFIRLTNEQQKSVGDFQSVFNLLDKMGTLMDEVFPETESFTGRIIGGTKRWVGAKAQTNEAAARLEKLIKGSMSKIIRAMGEKGTLSDGDVNRALNLFSRLYDDADVARSAFKELKGLFQANFRAVFGQPRIQSGEFETGKIYPGEGGTKAKYLGGGEWEIQ
uniref:Uncharacterized protein n=1 Tax=uncultured marine virus TaxID=186617 RepID=A0A0F7L1S5_9VIRU|nr:hypothetical protein [uncultured marine virus]